MKKQEIAKLMPKEAHKRIASAQTIVVIGPTSSGKSTLIYALVNHCIIKYIMVGIGEKCQTTIIPCNFLFDERIEKDEFFSLKIRRKDFSPRIIHIKILEMLSKQFAQNDSIAEETIDSIDKNVFESVLEPSDAAYHLSKIAEQISLDEFKNVIAEVLHVIEKKEPSFKERTRIKKKEPDKSKVSLDEIRSIVFEDMWGELSFDLLEGYNLWLDSIGKKIEQKLNLLINTNDGVGEISAYSTEDNDILPYGGAILQSLFDPFEPYSLVVEDMAVACRPRQQFIDMADENIPLRFCLRDTMGLNQINMENNSIKNALDIALNCSPDSILLLMNLEEREDVIADCCDVIGQKIGKAKKLDVPVNVIFTKADIIIGNIINKVDRNTVELTQVDYNKNIESATSAIELSIEKYLTKLPQENATWLSIRYLEERIDPIQMALKSIQSDKIKKFRKDGLYEKINSVIRDTQARVLPDGMETPLFVTVKDTGLSAVELKIDGTAIASVFSQIQNSLTKDKAIVNHYLIKDTRRIHGRSVVNYYNNLQHGMGYQTKAFVYGNFNINMKGMLNRVLCSNIPTFISLYESGVVKTLADNLEECELARLIEIFDENHEISKIAFVDINPAIFDDLPSKARKVQKLHLIFRHYFNSSDKYYMVMDKVAFKLSYGNEKIRHIIDSIYRKPISYDETIREMQLTFQEIFGQPYFAHIIAEEIGIAMTELVNKMFIII